MRHVAVVTLAVLAAIAIPASRASAQDYDAMAKWTEAKVIHYRMAGEFSGAVGIAVSGHNLPTPVTDRVELEFDWNQEEHRLVGTPVIRNFPSKAGALVPALGCPASRVTGTFELATFLSLKDQPDETTRITTSRLVMESRRDYLGGEFPLLPASSSQSCGAGWEKIAAKSVVTSELIDVPLAMMIAMGTGGTGMEISKDKKSIILTDAEKPGWIWTMTPTIVK